MVTLVTLTFGGCLAFIRYAEGEDTIATFDCRDGREIVITAARSWEISQPLCYLVRVDENVIVPTTCIGNNDPDVDPRTLGFTLVESSDPDLFAVTYSDNPSSYLMIHDFGNGHSFPRGDHINWNPNLDVNENREVRNNDRDAMESRLNSTRTRDSTGG